PRGEHGASRLDARIKSGHDGFGERVGDKVRFLFVDSSCVAQHYPSPFVIAGPDPAIHGVSTAQAVWMPGSSPGMTVLGRGLGTRSGFCSLTRHASHSITLPLSSLPGLTRQSMG